MRNSFRENNLVLPNLDDRYIVVDTETTGLFHHKDDHAIELAAVEVLSGKLTGNQLHYFFQPRSEINGSALSKHGMDQEFYESNYKGFCVDERTMMNNFVNFVKDSALVAHNAFFDMNFINKELRRFEIPPYSRDRFICTMEIFRYKVSSRGSNTRLNKCAEFFKIHNDENLLHSALYDALLCAKLLIKMTFFITFPEKSSVLTTKTVNQKPKSYLRVKNTTQSSKLDAKENSSSTKSTEENKLGQEQTLMRQKTHSERELEKEVKKKKSDESAFLSMHLEELEVMLKEVSSKDSFYIPSDELHYILAEQEKEENELISPDLNKIHFEVETNSETVNFNKSDFS